MFLSKSSFFLFIYMITCNSDYQHILKYHYRSGSTLLGTIASITPGTTYYFEPLHSFPHKFQWKHQVAPKQRFYSTFILNLLRCSPKSVHFVRMYGTVTKSNSKNGDCFGGNDVVIKNIRLTAEHVKNILENSYYNEDIKIIHLIR